MRLYIHTYGRANKQITLERFKPIEELVWLVVQEREEHLYDYPRTLVLPDSIRTLSPTRQWILENAKAEKIVMLDDDLAFYRRKSKADWHLRYCNEDDLWDLVDWFDSALDKYSHVGVSAREGNNRIERLEVENTRMMRCLGYNRKKVLKTGARFDRLPTKQDFDMTLQLLRKGHANLVSFEFAQGQWNGSQAEGGCSVYRTEQMMTESAEALAKLHPGFVKLREKTTKTAWKSLGGVRIDVTCYWQKAFQSSKTLRKRAVLLED